MGLGLEDVEDTLDCVIEVELLQLDLALLQQSAQAPDDLSGPLIVAPDIGEDFLQLVQVGGFAASRFGSLGVAQDSSQRLIELVRDRGRQGARGGVTVQMNDFHKTTARFQFCDLTAVTSPAARRSSRTAPAQWREPSSPASGIAPTGSVGENGSRFPAAAGSRIPKRWSCRQSNTGLVKSPGQQEFRGIFAVEDTQREPCRRLADRDRSGNKAAGTAMTYIGLYVDHDRPVGHFGKSRKAFMRNICRPRAVERDARVNDRRIVRQYSHSLPDFSHRQTDQANEFKFASKSGDFLLVMAAYGLTVQRCRPRRFASGSAQALVR